jgi:hypothetical protein
MKRSKIFMAAGAFVLAVTAMFATKANKKFASFTTGYIGSTGAYVSGFAANTLTTTKGTFKTAFVTLYTSASKHVTVLRATNGGNVLYHE